MNIVSTRFVVVDNITFEGCARNVIAPSLQLTPLSVLDVRLIVGTPGYLLISFTLHCGTGIFTGIFAGPTKVFSNACKISFSTVGRFFDDLFV